MVSPKNSFLDWDTTAGNNTDVGGIGILGTNAVNNFDDAVRTIMAQLRSGVDGKVVYASKSGNYTAVANDNNAVHRFTATATLSLTPAATLGTGWHYTIIADGAAVTIDPNGSETINGLATLIVPNGSSTTIICDGSGFFTVIKPALWEPIFSGPVSAITQWAATNLAAYESLRLRIDLANDSVAGKYNVSISEDNGSTWVAGTNYTTQDITGANTTAAASLSNGASSWTVAADNTIGLTSGGAGLMEAFDFHSFNKARSTRFISHAGWQQSVGVPVVGTHLGICSRAIAANAIRVTAAQASSGVITLEGMRG